MSLNNTNQSETTEVVMEISETAGHDLHAHVFSSSSQDTNSSKASAWMLTKRYLTSFYFIELVFYILYGTAVFFGSRSVTIYERPFPFQSSVNDQVILDQSLLHELVPSIISNSLLLITCFLVPMVLQCILSFVFGEEGDTHRTLCNYIFGVTTSDALTRTIKHYTGVFRPNFYAGCIFDLDQATCTEEDYSIYIRSFPSGHATIGFCGMTLFTMYLLRTFTSNKNKDSPMQIIFNRFKSILCHSPMIYAFFVAANRVRLNKHFPADITAGACIGVLCAIVAFNIWFPNRSS